MDHKEKARRAAQRKARLEKERRKKRLTTAGCVLAALLLVVAMPFAINALRAKPARDVTTNAPQSSALADVGGAPLPPMANGSIPTPLPTPTPSPSPTPEITPEPTPTPVPTATPYVCEMSGQKVNPDKKMIAITFDDGPGTKSTDRILKALKKNKAKATFFVLGENALNHPDRVKQMVEDGHQIGTHTYGHKSLTKLDAAGILEEVNKSLDAIERAGGVRPKILRPPYGNVNDTVRETLQMPLINWSVDTLDWKSRDAKKVVKHMLEDVKDGDIVLLHEIYDSTAEAIEKALPKLAKEGYQFVTIDELFASKGIQPEFGQVYYNAR